MRSVYIIVASLVLVLWLERDTPAALLGRYLFTSDANATPTTGLSGYSLGAFTNVDSGSGAGGVPGSVVSNAWYTSTAGGRTVNNTISTVNYNQLTITASSAMSVSSIDLKMWVVLPASPTAISNLATLDVTYAKNPGSSSTYTAFGGKTLTSATRNSASSASQTLTLPTPVSLASGDNLVIRFQWYRSGSGTAGGQSVTRIGMDDLNIYGSATVPEPTTMCIFSLVVVGGMVARRRNSSKELS